MKGVLLAGGTGSRLRPITHTGPKQLIPIANKPVIQYAIEDLKEAGITEIGVVLGTQGREAVQEFLGDGSDLGVEITYIVQGKPLGLAHAVGCTRDFVDGDDFVVYLGDNMLNEPITRFVDRFAEGDYSAGVALQRVPNPEQFGVATLDEAGNVVRIDEKPENPESDLVVIGIYLFSAAVFDAVEGVTPSERGELEITDVFQTLIDEGKPVYSHRVEGWWKDTGKPEDILEANRLVLDDAAATAEGTVDPGAETMGKIDLHDSATIEAGAVVRGPVSIAENVVIGGGTYVGPYTSIGPDTEIRGAHVENSVVIGESTITAREKFVDSLIGRGTVMESKDGYLPDGHRLVIGENSRLKL
jgi:glucose-1-phosphate thymidylyltransferase